MAVTRRERLLRALKELQGMNGSPDLIRSLQAALEALDEASGEEQW